MPPERPPIARTGIGYDSHRFAPGRALILGGVTIPSEVGLEGHSDADAVAHAVTDALLGAACEGDIGTMFPDTDPANRNRDSLEMLSLAVERLKSKGFFVVHADITVIAERPRIGPHRAAIQESLSGALSISPSEISLKAKTNEGMGWIGRGEGLACIAVATVATVAESTG
ncbi:MAG TPA: 2-C-methyl-D-erythritol 2,4-cyclodiphosphate synthase [Gemmatimonadaceae bacterium]|nr:2-C-methyl-D-erythritol 2,4-cyclodiphosphate synthase [Gemmatimonadaceae bacterium]